MFSRRAKRKLYAFVQVLTACATLLLLTATVMHRADEDGYQAAHLFFMPRQNWEMDEGRGMLHEVEYYGDMDERAMLEELYGVDAGYLTEHEEGRELDKLREADEPDRVAEQEREEPEAHAGSPGEEPYREPSPEREQPDEGRLFNSHKLVLRRAPHPRPFVSNELPTIKPVEESLHRAAQPVAVGKLVTFFADWQPDVPSPPPRRARA